LAIQLREGGLPIRSVAAKIRFPFSTVAAALKAHSLVKAQKLAVKLERAARTTRKSAEQEKAHPSKHGGLPELKPDPAPPADLSVWEALEKVFNTRTEPNQ
jgi:hypothetical protein